MASKKVKAKIAKIVAWCLFLSNAFNGAVDII